MKGNDVKPESIRAGWSCLATGIVYRIGNWMELASAASKSTKVTCHPIYIYIYSIYVYMYTYGFQAYKPATIRFSILQAPMFFHHCGHRFSRPATLELHVPRLSAESQLHPPGIIIPREAFATREQVETTARDSSFNRTCNQKHHIIHYIPYPVLSIYIYIHTLYCHLHTEKNRNNHIYIHV